jgi:hypothetical protein
VSPQGEPLFAPPEVRRAAPSVRFPLHIEGGAILVECESGWMREEAGTGQMTPAMGFVLIGADGREQTVYHAWGNL